MEIKNGGRPIRQKLQVLSYLSPPQKKANFRFVKNFFTAARLAQLGERRSAEREAVGSNPGRTNTQDL